MNDCTGVCTCVYTCVCVYRCMYVCMYQNSLWCVSQLTRHTTRTLDIAVAVAFMLTLKMDEEALDRCIEKNLWCKPHNCKEKTGNVPIMTLLHTYQHNVIQQIYVCCIHTRVPQFGWVCVVCEYIHTISSFMCKNLRHLLMYSCLKPSFWHVFVRLLLMEGMQWRRLYTLGTCRT